MDRMKKQHPLRILTLLALLVTALPAAAVAAPPPGAPLSKQALSNLIRPQGTLSELSKTPALLHEDRLVGVPTTDRGRLEAFAAKVSYAGVLLLTADRIVRSMDSVLEHMQIATPDGTRIRLEMGPTSYGMNVGIRLSRPIEF